MGTFRAFHAKWGDEVELLPTVPGGTLLAHPAHHDVLHQPCRDKENKINPS